MVDPALAIQRLEAYPEVAAAQVEVVWPNRLTVEVEERMPVVAWDDGGRSWLLSREGVAYLQRDVMTQVVHIRADQPVLRLSEDPNEPAIATSILDAALALAAEAPSETVFTFDAIHGLGFQDRRGWQVYFGAAGDMAAKVRMYQALGVDLERRGVVVEMVSVEDLEMPYYKKGR
jgi:hypothetical protein